MISLNAPQNAQTQCIGGYFAFVVFAQGFWLLEWTRLCACVNVVDATCICNPKLILWWVQGVELLSDFKFEQTQQLLESHNKFVVCSSELLAHATDVFHSRKYKKRKLQPYLIGISMFCGFKYWICVDCNTSCQVCILNDLLVLGIRVTTLIDFYS